MSIDSFSHFVVAKGTIIYSSYSRMIPVGNYLQDSVCPGNLLAADISDRAGIPGIVGIAG